jgi:hypothetical protein
MYLSCPIDPPEVRSTGFAPDPGPRDPGTRAESPRECASIGGASSEFQVWSSGTLVAIVRRREGRTVEVIRVAGER